MPLSEFTIRHARSTGKNYTLGDFDGLSLGVSKVGGKIWLFRNYWEGRQKRMSFGTYPEVSLKQARERRDEARKLSAENVNPCAHRKQQRREAEAEEKHTFQAVYDEWIDFRRLSLNEGRQSTLSQILRVFKKDVLPTLAERAIKSITRHDLLAILSTIEQRKAFTMAVALASAVCVDSACDYYLINATHPQVQTHLLETIEPFWFDKRYLR